VTLCRYNLVRLKTYLVNSCFEASGTALVHHLCLKAALGVGSGFVSACHAAAIRWSQNATVNITKKLFISLKLNEEDLLRKEGSVRCHTQYLKSLEDDAEVTVVARASQHALRGKLSNRRLSEQRDLFRTWVVLNRAPTGRTKDAGGRFHGAEYHFLSKLKYTLVQSGRDAPTDDAEVVELAFAAALRAVQPTLKVPCGTTIRNWLNEDFGIGSKHEEAGPGGHTVKFPHQTDACASCASWNVDINSIKQSIKRHKQQTGDMSAERQVFPRLPPAPRTPHLPPTPRTSHVVPLTPHLYP
jgi:hypothetical protein